MKDRIKQLMESQHMTQQTFSDFIGISSASLSSIFNGRTKPTLNTVEAIRSKFPSISLDWLMYGIEPMFSNREQNGGAEPVNKPVESKFNEPTLNFQNDIPVRSFTGATNLRNQTNERDFTKLKDESSIENKIIKEVQIVDAPKRNITEIRIFFDDQTWETFVPQK